MIVKITKDNADLIKVNIYKLLESIIRDDPEYSDFMDEPEIIKMLGESINQTIDDMIGLEIDDKLLNLKNQFLVKNKNFTKNAGTKKMPWTDRFAGFTKKLKENYIPRAKAAAGGFAAASWEKIKAGIAVYFKDIVKNAPEFLNQITDPTVIRDTAGSFFANKAILESSIPELYSPSAYEKLVNEKGFGGQALSEGAYDIPGADLKSQFKKFYPDLASSTKYKDPDIQKELKTKFSKVEKNKKFIKISQVTSQPSSENMKAQIDELRNNLPEWQVTDILGQIKLIADNKQLSLQDKQRSVADLVVKYANAIKNLEEILNKNVKLPEIQ